MHNIGYLGLGSNMGDRIEHLKTAVSLIAAHPEIEVAKRASFYTTAPVGYLEQDDFINTVIEIRTSLKPLELLAACQQVEQTLKRERLIHWGPRTIDVDILWLDNFESSEAHLQVPHPRMQERAFVMVPLSEINPALEIAGASATVWCAQLSNQEVRKMIHEKW